MLGSKSNRVILYLSAFFIIVLVLFAILRDNSNQITLNHAKKLLANNDVTQVVATKDYIYLRTPDDIYRISASQVTPQMFANYKVEISSGGNVVLYIVILVLLLGTGSFFVRWWLKYNTFEGFTRPTSRDSNSVNDIRTPIAPITTDVSFDDIGGISDVKMELEEIIDFMKNPKRYTNFGARMPRGVLLVGPPGVGKTMIAKAVANEANAPFFYQSGASFVQIYVGMGAKRVHDLFQAAKNNAPSIIFIDEIDAVGKKRDGQRNDEREATLNQLLTEMDGFEGSSGVIVVAATNKIDILDPALLRAGRFDRRIFVELPTKRERQSILSKYLIKVPNEVDVKALANMTTGFNGASLAALVNEAALLSLRNNNYQVTMDHFHQVKDKVMFGKKKLQMLSDKQKEYHVTYQAGKVLGATYFDLSFEKLMLSNEKLTPSTNEPMLKHELESRVKMLLSGIVACSIKFNEHSSSAQNDLQEAKELVSKMINDYGMGESLISSENDEERFMQKLYDECKILVESMSDVMKQIESVLNEKESISKNAVQQLIENVR